MCVNCLSQLSEGEDDDEDDDSSDSCPPAACARAAGAAHDALLGPDGKGFIWKCGDEGDVV